MEALLQQQLSEPLDMAGISKSTEDSDVLMLDYINEILMEEGMDDATCMQQVSYQAIFSDFQDILGEHFSPNSCVDSTSDGDVFDMHGCMYPYHEKGSHEHHVKVANPNDGFYSMTNEPRLPLPASGHPQSSFQQERAKVGFTLKPDAGFQGHVMASHTPLKSTQITALYEMKNGMYNSSSRLGSTGLNEASVALSSRISTMAQVYIKLNDGVFMDVMVPCGGKGAVVGGLSGHRCMGGLGQRCSNLRMPSVDEDSSSKLAEVDLSFKDLRLKDFYTDFYVGEPTSLGSSTRGARDIKHNGYKKKSLTVAGNRNISTLEVHMFVDLKETLLSCAQAVAIGDARRANEILHELRHLHHATANGSGMQRTAHFFSEALAARLRGMGGQHFRAISHNIPPAATLLRDSKLGFGVGPFMMVMHYFANQSILKAAEGASRLHVLDYGFLYGMQWPCLIHALADRKGGPPFLVITGIEYPQSGINLEESGRRLAAYAKTYGVPFQYHAVVTDKWEDLDAASLHLHEGEILVVNCLKHLNHLADESADLALPFSPRQKLLTCIHSLNPHLLVTAVVSAAYNSPFFVSRFRDALYYYSNLLDMLDTLCGDTTQRLLIERSCFYRDIINIVACEGAERVERPETYKQWHARITKAGFEQLRIPPEILSRSRSHVKLHHHKDFLIPDDANGWMLMGWKGYILRAISAWKPSLL